MKTSMKISIIMILLVFLLTGCNKQAKTPGEIINEEDSFSVITEEVLNIPRIDDNFRIMQGGCVSDKYAWFLIVSAENYKNDLKKETIILQFDRETMQEVARSEKLKLGHANDMVYVEESNALYVSQAFQNKVTIIDADTLTEKDVKRLVIGQGAIDYDASRDCFVTSMGKCDVVYWNEEFKTVGSAKAPVETTLVTQGICADDHYIYHVLYSTKSNEEEPDHIILVVDWDGNFITKIPIGLKEVEPENISIVGDTFYIGCNDGDGGVVYTAKLVKE